MATHIATITDKKYILNALALLSSARIHITDVHVWIICLDNESLVILQKEKIPNTTILKIEDLGDKELLEAAKSRTISETAFTAKSCIISYIMKSPQTKEGDIIIWSDSDIFFFSSATSFLNKIELNYSIAITPHKFSRGNERKINLVGFYNAGMIFFKKDNNSRQCLTEWRKQCIDWCYYRLEDGKLGDQMYLDKWKEKYKQVYEIQDKGINLGSWNIRNYKIRENSDGNFYVDSELLICYHFHGLNIYLNKKGKIKIYPIGILHKKIYDKYIETLQIEFEKIKTIDKNWNFGFTKRLDILRLIKQHMQRLIQNVFN